MIIKTGVLVIYVVRCAIWYHVYNLKNVKNTYGGVLILVKLPYFDQVDIDLSEPKKLVLLLLF